MVDKIEVLHNVLAGVQDRNTGLPSPNPVCLIFYCIVKVFSLMQCIKVSANGIAWHNDELVDVDYIVDFIDHSNFGQQTMDRATDVIKQAQNGVCKGDFLQPRQNIC